MYIILIIFPLIDELDFFHQITDNYTVTHQFNPDYASTRPKFLLSFLWKSSIFWYSAKIVMLPFYKLKIKLETQNNFYIQDGPGSFSEGVNIRYKGFVLLSSNQAFCTLFTKSKIKRQVVIIEVK